MRAAVIGAGAFGTALSNVLAVNCDEVRLWGREAELMATINSRHENVTYLPGIPIAPNVRATTSFEEALEQAEIVVSAAPSQVTREVMGKAKAFLPHHVPIITVSKG